VLTFIGATLRPARLPYPHPAMAMLEKSEQGFKENYALLKKLSEM